MALCAPALVVVQRAWRGREWGGHGRVVPRGADAVQVVVLVVWVVVGMRVGGMMRVRVVLWVHPIVGEVLVGMLAREGMRGMRVRGELGRRRTRARADRM